jgi:hypothetical protein
MSKGLPWRLLSAAAALALLGLLAAAVALKVLFPEPRVRAYVVNAARRQLGRDVRLSGLGVGLGGLRLDGLEISEFPDFSAGVFLKADRLRLRPSWRALLRRRFVVASVSVENPTVRLARSADARWNFSTLASSAPASAPPPARDAPAAAPPEFAVRRAAVSGGTIEYSDAAAGSTWTITGLSAEIDGFGPAAPFGASASLRARGRAGARPVDASLSFDGRIDLARGRREAFRADVRRLVVEQDGARLEASGSVSGLDAPDVAFDAALSAAGRALLRAKGKARLGASVDVDADVRSEALDAATAGRLLAPAGIPPLPLPALDLEAAGAWSGSALTLRSARLSWSGGKIEGEGSARGLGGSAPAFAGRASFAADVPRIAPGGAPFLKLPAKLGLPASRLEGELVLADHDLTVKSLRARTVQGTIDVSGLVRRVDSAKPAADLAAQAALSLPAFRGAEFPWDGVLPPTLAVPPLRLDGTVKLRGDDVLLQKLVVGSSAGKVVLDGTFAGALAGRAETDLDAVVDLSLPALSDADLPFPGVPAGLRFPASRWSGGLSYSPRAVRLRELRARVGRNDVEAAGTLADLSGRGSFDVLVKCRSFALEDLAGLTPAIRELKLGGGGFFAVSVVGTKDKPEFAGKLQFKGLGATVAGLPLSDFSGTASFDKQNVHVPNLAGKVADGALRMDIGVLDYARAPDVELSASLDRFDFGGYLEAKKRWLASSPPPAAAKSSAAAAAPPAAPPKPLRTRGDLSIGTLSHPSATVSNVKAAWDLSGITPDLKQLNGSAQLSVGDGKIRSVGDLATQSLAAKILLSPLIVVQKIGRIGGIRLFPDYNNIELSRLVGDYLFHNGVMALRQSEMDSSAASVSAKGTIDLPSEALDLVMTTQVKTNLADFAPVDVVVTGTFDQPKTSVKVGKALIQAIQGLIQK